MEYRGEDGRWHRYTPDFLIRKCARPGQPAGTGRVLIVEIKGAHFAAGVRDDQARFERGEEPQTPEGRKMVALRRLERFNPDSLRYELIFVDRTIPSGELTRVRRFIREPERLYAARADIVRRIRDRILVSDGRAVRRVILFGSRARGDARPDSDYDILVLVSGMDAAQRSTFASKLYRAVEGIGAAVEPWVMSEEEFEESKTVVGGLAYPAWKEGVILHPDV